MNVMMKNNEKIHIITKAVIKSYVELMNENKEPIHEEPIYIHQMKDDIEIEIAIQYNSGYATNLLSYANNIHTYEGGTHEDGFKRALTCIK